MANSIDVVDQYTLELRQFNERMQAQGIDDIDRYYWYHTIDLPGGIVTPGLYDYRDSLAGFQFPDDMRGKTVLDVGSATGFFAFEFERRGAQVVSVELPSLECLDRFPGQETSSLLRKIQHMIVPHSADRLGMLVHEYSAQELHYYMLDAPFQLCARLLNSRVERRYSTIYELSAERLGQAGFDFVFLGDILVHTLRPFDAIVAAAGMCRGALVVAQMMPGEPEDAPAMIYQGGRNPLEDDICWWLPNEQCFRQILLKLGFATAEVAGTYEGILRPAGHPYTRRVLHARRAMAL